MENQNSLKFKLDDILIGRRSAAHDFSDEQDEAATTHDSDFIHRMLQLHARLKPETEDGDMLLHSV